MNDVNFTKFYSYVSFVLPEFIKDKENLYFLNNVLTEGINYNKNLFFKTGIDITEQLLHKEKIMDSTNNLDLPYYGKDYIDPLKIMLRKEQLYCVNRAFNILPNNLKKIIDLYLFQEFDFQYIANYFNESISNIKSYYFWGLSLVKYYFIYYYHVKSFVGKF